MHLNISDNVLTIYTWWYNAASWLPSYNLFRSISHLFYVSNVFGNLVDISFDRESSKDVLLFSKMKPLRFCGCRTNNRRKDYPHILSLIYKHKKIQKLKWSFCKNISNVTFVFFRYSTCSPRGFKFFDIVLPFCFFSSSYPSQFCSKGVIIFQVNMENIEPLLRKLTRCRRCAYMCTCLQFWFCVFGSQNHSVST